MIVPIGNNRLAAGNRLRKANATNKKAIRLRRYKNTDPVMAATTASQAIQSLREPETRGISEYE